MGKVPALALILVLSCCIKVTGRVISYNMPMRCGSWLSNQKKNRRKFNLNGFFRLSRYFCIFLKRVFGKRKSLSCSPCSAYAKDKTAAAIRRNMFANQRLNSSKSEQKRFLPNHINSFIFILTC